MQVRVIIIEMMLVRVIFIESQPDDVESDYY